MTEVAEGDRRAATTHLAMESRARPHEAAAVTTTVEQRMSDNRVTGHHAWNRVCVNSVAAKHNQQIEIGMQGESNGTVPRGV